MQAGLGPVFSTQLQARKVIWQGGGGGCRAVPRDSWCQGRGSLQQASKRDPYLHLPAAAGRSVLLNCNSWCLSKIFTQSLGIIDPKIPSQHRTHQPPATDFSVLSDLQSCQRTAVCCSHCLELERGAIIAQRSHFLSYPSPASASPWTEIFLHVSLIFQQFCPH